jgi:hypothetical protein
LSLSPRNSTFELALSLLRAQDFAAAENCLREVLQGQPGHVGALNVLALLLAQSGRHAQAERDDGREPVIADDAAEPPPLIAAGCRSHEDQRLWKKLRHRINPHRHLQMTM